jgi:hypothetical protein
MEEQLSKSELGVSEVRILVLLSVVSSPAEPGGHAGLRALATVFSLNTFLGFVKQILLILRYDLKATSIAICAVLGNYFLILLCT